MFVNTCKKLVQKFQVECNMISLPFILLANHLTEVPRIAQPTAQPGQMCKYEWFETSTLKSILEI